MNITTTSRRRGRLLVAGLALTALLAACGGDDDAAETSTPSAPAAAAAPATTAAPVEDDAYGGLYDVDPSATPATAAPAPAAADVTMATAETELGTILVDDAGMTLYAFTEDTDGVATCAGACADAWPPALVDGQQLVAGNQPLYTFAGDSAPGETFGQGSGDVWFVVAPDGTLIR